MRSLLNFAGVLVSQGSRRIGLSAALLAGALLLSACGGNEAPGLSTPAAAVPTVTVTLTDSSGASVNSLTRAAPLTATATLVGANGRPVANSLIQFSLTFGGASTPAVLSPSSGSGITDANGKFSVALIAANSTAEGGGSITATAVNQTDASPATSSFQVKSSTPTVTAPALTLSLTDPNTGASRAIVSRAAPLAAVATLLDGSGRPVTNSLIQFSLTFAGSTTPALLSPSSGSGVTDANGKIVVELVAANATSEGSGTITATAVNLTEAAPVTATFQVVASTPPVTAPALTLALTDPQTGASRSTLSRATPLAATATLLDGSGRPVANSLVQFSLTFAGASSVAVLSPSSGSGVTDANGKVAVALLAPSLTGEGSGTITATAVNLTTAPPASSSFQVVATTPPAPAPVVTLALTDPATGASLSTLTLASPLNATATLVDANGRPLANSLIQFSLTTAGGGAPVAVFAPASGNGVTDANGRFVVTLQSAGLTAQGAGTVRATAVNETNAPSASASFQVGATPISLGNVTRTPAEVDPLQTSTITVQVTGVPPSVPVTVRFTSPCASVGLASLPAAVVTVNGVATAVYTDKGCSGTDQITISSDGSASIQTSINVLQAPPVAIQFVSATPDVMSVSGGGGQPSSVVVFKVVNAAQQPVPDLPVTLSLSTSVGGVTLDGQSGSVTKRTAQDGTVRVTVIAGTQPGPVRVAASASGGLSALSSLLTIQTGLPTQARFSLSFQTFNIEGWNVDGTSTSVTIRAADRVGNPVPDGSTINFRSSGALVEPSCRTSGGACSVNFRSQANRPASGRIAVLAWAVGEENFADLNGNNQYDPGEPFGDLGDAFVDANLNGTWDPGEEFIAYYPLGTGACAESPLSAPGVPTTCDGVWGLAHVRASGQVVLSGSNAFAPNLPATVRLAGPADLCEGSVSFTLIDVNGNPMPAGTTVSSSLGGDIFGSPVANTVNPTGVSIQLSLPAEVVPNSDPEVKRCQGQGVKTLRITVTSPLGTTTVLPPVIVTY